MRFAVRRVSVLVSSLVLAGVSTAAVGPPAWAGSSEYISTARGVVAWLHDGDTVYAKDKAKDGLSIEANYRRQGGSTHVLHVAGNGNSDSRVWNLPEGTNVEIRMCYRDGSVVTKCSGWQNAEA